MPLLKNKHQPYFTDPDSPNQYQCGREQYCHPVLGNDPVMTQFYQTPCGSSLLEDPSFSDITLGAELITNGTFTGSAAGWTLDGFWVYGTDNIERNVSQQADNDATQTGLAITGGNYYQLMIDVTRTGGLLTILVGGVAVATITDTGSYTFTVQAGSLDTEIIIRASGSLSTAGAFFGNVDNVSLKEITFNSWNPFGDWILSDGLACPLPSGGSLIETVADYLLAGNYYQFTFSVTGYQAGALEVYISDILAGTITSEGIFTLYATPTVDGVIEFRASPDSVFCLDLETGTDDYPPGTFQLRNDYSGNIINDEGDSVYNLDLNYSYFEDYVTLIFDFATLGLDYGCYTYEVYDACEISGANLVTNGDFADGSTGWVPPSSMANQQVVYASNALEFNFTPYEGTDYVTNGDFATGDFTGWTASAGLAVVVNEVVHTPGTIDTLTQSIVLPAPAPPGQVLQFFVGITVSGRTAGSINITLGDVTFTNLTSNDDMVVRLIPTVGGAQPLTITFSSDFDGNVDDITLFETTGIWSANILARNAVNPLIVAGNYELEFEIISTTDTRNKVGVYLEGSDDAIQYFSTVGVHTVTINNYTPGNQRVALWARFVENNYNVIGSIVVDNVQARRIEPFDATYTSECLDYKLTHPRTMIMQGYCDQPAFGFEFANSGFFLQQRVEIRSFGEQYNDDTLISRSGSGSIRLDYASLETMYVCHTSLASSSFHAAMSVIIRCDHFGVGNTQDTLTEYVAEPGSYFISWQPNGSYALAAALFNAFVKIKNQLFNRHI